MKRNSLLALLSSYTTSDMQESEMVKETQKFVTENVDCFERSLASGHVTASACVVSEEGDLILLMHHRKLDRWFQPGGHCDGDPDVMGVAKKEVEEETGVTDITLLNPGVFDVDIHLIPANSKDPAHYHYDIRFLFQADANRPLTINSESKELRWVPLREVVKLNDSPSIMRMVSKVIS